VSERKTYLNKESKLSLRLQAELLEVDRSCLYYHPVGESSLNLTLMELIDKLFLDDPTLGVKGMRDELRTLSYEYNDKRIRRLMRKMALMPIYSKKNLSRLGLAKYIHPYLLRHLSITRPNQVWAIDITYIPMRHGFMYLTAIIDVYSRFVVGWQVSNTLDKENQTSVLHEAIRKHGVPEIVNSDQGAQYTCEHWVSTVRSYGIHVSMDGKGRATDNAFIERFWGTIKRKHIYLNPAEDGLELYQGIANFILKYNHRHHQGINRQKPIDLYTKAA
jgi:putative transposase